MKRAKQLELIANWLLDSGWKFEDLVDLCDIVSRHYGDEITLEEAGMVEVIYDQLVNYVP